ncbi:MAG: hypothetical protein NC401_18610, partial [Ruminococcus sp.]|nr:hypothetical protein [Ruminococcus sp.]
MIAAALSSPISGSVCSSSRVAVFMLTVSGSSGSESIGASSDDDVVVVCSADDELSVCVDTGADCDDRGGCSDPAAEETGDLVDDCSVDGCLEDEDDAGFIEDDADTLDELSILDAELTVDAEEELTGVETAVEDELDETELPLSSGRKLPDGSL